MNWSTKLRAVFDTNILISGVIWGGNPGLSLNLWRRDKFILLISPFILAELTNFLEVYGVEAKEKQAIINEFKTKSIKILPQRQAHVCRDEKDNQILDLCLAGRADFLITGDKDLLALKKFKETRILKPKEFLQASKHWKEERKAV